MGFYASSVTSYRERDELLVALRAVRVSQQEAQHREWSACLQVKQAVEMAEDANLHKARVRGFFTQLKHFNLWYLLVPTISAYVPHILRLFVCMQVEVQCEHLSRELARQREQLEREAQALQERLSEAREEGRSEVRKQKEELAHTVNITYFLFKGNSSNPPCIHSL